MPNCFLIKKKLNILLASPTVGNYIKNKMKVGGHALIHSASLSEVGLSELEKKTLISPERNRLYKRSMVDIGNSQ